MTAAAKKAERVTYRDMWFDALDRAGAADDLLREYRRVEDALEPIDPEHVARAEKRFGIAKGQANLIAWCERHKDYVAKSLEKEAAEQAAREASAGLTDQPPPG